MDHLERHHLKNPQLSAVRIRDHYTWLDHYDTMRLQKITTINRDAKSKEYLHKNSGVASCPVFLLVLLPYASPVLVAWDKFRSNVPLVLCLSILIKFLFV